MSRPVNVAITQSAPNANPISAHLREQAHYSHDKYLMAPPSDQERVSANKALSFGLGSSGTSHASDSSG